MTSNLQKIEYLASEQGQKELTSIFDHTFLKTEGHFSKEKNPVMARARALEDFLNNGAKLPGSAYSFCVRPEDVALTYQSLRGKSTKTCSVVGFPYGPGFSTKQKVRETELAIEGGATEIDMVQNYLELKKGNYEAVEKDIFEVVNLSHYHNALTKVILETSTLTKEEIRISCDIAESAGADFVKTCTGFNGGIATQEDLTLMRTSFPNGGVKASGGLKPENIYQILQGLSGRIDGLIELNPLKIRGGEGSYFSFAA